MSTMPDRDRYFFNEFDLDPRSRVLRRNGEAVTLNSKAFDVLLELVKAPGEVVSKQHFLDKVWPDQFVEENNLTVQISALRKVFGERKGENNYIVTIPGRGYSFAGNVTVDPYGDSRLERVSPALVTGLDSEDELIGREREINELAALIAAGKRLITLTGAGGCGKSRLAAGVMTRLKARFADGAFFVELADVSDAAHLPQAICEKLEIKQTRQLSPIDSLHRHLAGKKVLLVLDNFEQIMPGATVVRALAEQHPDLTILITSRVPLRCRGETEYSVGPLELPPEDMAVTTALETAALQLFVLRARSARKAFSPTDDNVPSVVAICRWLDGLPLAIELAAARVKLLSPEAILERLRSALELLTGGGADVPDRQRTMRNTLMWSYDLLDGESQDVFRALAVFAGGFTIEAAEYLFADRSDLTASVLDIITGLADSGLLTSHDEPDGNVRLGMLEVVRQFALSQSGAVEDISRYRRRHAEYYLSLAERAEPHLVSGETSEWTRTLHTEMGNIRSAIQFSLDHAPELAARLTAAVRYYWINRSQLVEGCHLMSKALELANGPDVEVRFKLAAGLGSFYRLRGDYEQSRHYYAIALVEGEAAGIERHIALATAGLGTVLMLEGKVGEAARSFNDALTMSRRAGDRRAISIALDCLANVMLADGRPDEARRCVEESLGIYEELGESEAICNNLNILGKVALESSDDALAYDHYARALSLARTLDNKLNIIHALMGFSGLAYNSGNAKLAAAFCGAAGALSKEIDYMLEPDEEVFYRSLVTQARSRLDETTFTEASDQGRRMGMTQIERLIGRDLRDLAAVEDGLIKEIIVETRTTSKITIEDL